MFSTLFENIYDFMKFGCSLSRAFVGTKGTTTDAEQAYEVSIIIPTSTGHGRAGEIDTVVSAHITELTLALFVSKKNRRRVKKIFSHKSSRFCCSDDKSTATTRIAEVPKSS